MTDPLSNRQQQLRTTTTTTTASPESGGTSLLQSGQTIQSIRNELAKVIVGQDHVIEDILIALLAGGHALLEGVPGLAKTLLISTLAKTIDCSFSRIQFTPDLMPSDITGTEVIREDRASGERHLTFLPGPIFASVVLADEINRTPPKTQAALLEAMQERQVSAGGEIRPLPQPFFVLATQNPIEQEGTYPLPEAQLDRFLLKTIVSYPSESEELEVLKRTTGNQRQNASAVIAAADIAALQEHVREVAVADSLARYALSLVRATRSTTDGGTPLICQQLRWGAGPRAGQSLILAAKALAVLHQRDYVLKSDLDRVLGPVLRHRIQPSYEAAAQGKDSDAIITELLAQAQLPSSELENDPVMKRVLT